MILPYYLTLSNGDRAWASSMLVQFRTIYGRNRGIDSSKVDLGTYFLNGSFHFSVLWHPNRFHAIRFSSRRSMIIITIFPTIITLYGRMGNFRRFYKIILEVFSVWVHIISKFLFINNTSLFTEYVFKISFAFSKFFNNLFQIKNLFNFWFSKLRDSVEMVGEDFICSLPFSNTHFH